MRSPMAQWESSSTKSHCIHPWDMNQGVAEGLQVNCLAKLCCLATCIQVRPRIWRTTSLSCAVVYRTQCRPQFSTISPWVEKLGLYCLWVGRKRIGISGKPVLPCCFSWSEGKATVRTAFTQMPLGSVTYLLYEKCMSKSLLTNPWLKEINWFITRAWQIKAPVLQAELCELICVSTWLWWGPMRLRMECCSCQTSTVAGLVEKGWKVCVYAFLTRLRFGWEPWGLRLLDMDSMGQLLCQQGSLPQSVCW